MSFLGRLRAMLGLGVSAERLAVSTRVDVIAADDAARLVRLGDVDGQTERARAFAAELDRRLIR